MTEPLLSAGLHQALWLTLAVLGLRVARPLLLKHGATVTYAAWSLVPLLMLTPALPRPASEPLRVALEAVGPSAGAHVVALAALPLPSPAARVPWLVLWGAGTALVLAVLASRQWRVARIGLLLPAGSSPALVGLLRPRVALPVDFERRFPPAERELILAHEAVHRARLDNLWNLLAALVVALHWWNPLAWWAARRLHGDQELACDEAVLASRPGCAVTYRRALLAAHGLDSLRAPAASRWSSAHPLVERIAMLDRVLPGSRRRGAALAVALAAVAGLAWAGQAAPQAAAAAPSLRFDLLVAQQVGDHVHRFSAVVAGREGEPMRLDNTGDADGNPPISIELVARTTEHGHVQLDDVIREGEPPVVTTSGRMVLDMGRPSLVERVQAGGNRRTSLVIVPSRFERP